MTERDHIWQALRCDACGVTTAEVMEQNARTLMDRCLTRRSPRWRRRAAIRLRRQRRRRTRKVRAAWRGRRE